MSRPTASEGGAESELHEAAWRGDAEGLRALLKAGADPNWRDSIGEPALSGAAGWGHVEAVRVLLEHGARTDIGEYASGWLPLHWGARAHVEVTKLLVEAGASPLSLDIAGNLPIDIAHKYGKGDIVRFLKTVGPGIRSRRTKRASKRGAA